MKITYELNEHDKEVTPIKVADALIESDRFSRDQLNELAQYLFTYTRMNKQVVNGWEELKK